VLGHLALLTPVAQVRHGSLQIHIREVRSMVPGFTQNMLGQMRKAPVHDMFVHLVDVVALESNLLGVII
jgi:hypothetical protein